MKKLFFTLISFFFFLSSQARHVAGGELFYEYLGDGTTAGTSLYRISLRLFRDCASGGPLLENEIVNVGIYSSSGAIVSELSLTRPLPVERLQLRTDLLPCLVGNPFVCYEVAVFTGTISLANNNDGYTLSRVGCCRVNNISNLANPLNVGSNYVTKIPGLASLPSGQYNSSPQFRVKDTALVCSGKRFTLDFGAIDADNDSLSYSFCTGYDAPQGSNGNAPPRNLNLMPLVYSGQFNGSQPLGSLVNIDPKSGMISGIAPPIGQYVVSVCINEWRNGRLISEHRKDFIMRVDDCDLIEAVLPDQILKCDDNTVTFENNSTSSSIISYLWTFGVPGSPNNSSTLPKPTFTYADTGRYRVTLEVRGPGQCVGYDTTEVLIYPGFKTNFNVTGLCFQLPFQFADATVSPNGRLTGYKWDFGDPNQTNDTSNLAIASYKYANGGFDAAVKLVSRNDKGCVDSITKSIPIRDKPIIPLPFRDTVICSIDSLQIPLNYFGNGSITWSPATNIIGANTRNPTVFPKDTTRYIVTLNDGGCMNTDSVTVNVVDFITVSLGNDTTICLTDPITLRPQTIASTFAWTPATGLSNASIRNPIARPLQATTYTLTANLGRCQASDDITVNVAPYPISQITVPDTTICYGNRVTLRGNIVGSSYQWAPANALINTNTLNPIAGPSQTTWFTLTVTDPAGGCPKPVTDSVLVTVIPIITVQAGRDTSIVADQPLQLNATASTGNIYNWSPSLGVSNTQISNPVITLGTDVDSVTYRLRVSDAGGCFGEDDVVVRVFKGRPDILVPSAFTPNGDGRNDILPATGIGITQLQYFRIYNRWGQLVFQTQELNKGWNGLYQGVQQPSGTYVFMAQGTDYTGKTVFKKGTAVLIR